MWALGIALAGSQRRRWCAAALALVAAGGCTQSLDAPDSTFVKPLSLQIGAYFQPESPRPFEEFGWSLAIDGDAVAVAAPYEFADLDEPTPEGASKDNPPPGEGVVYLFTTDRDASEGLRVVIPNADRGDGQVSSLVRPDMAGQVPAARVAMNERWLIVGMGGEDGGIVPTDQPDSAQSDAAQSDNSAKNAGAVFVYARERLAHGDTTPLQYLKAPSIHADDAFGVAIALSGSTLVVGAPGDDGANQDDPDEDAAIDSGAAYVYVAGDDGHFELREYLKAPGLNRGHDFFGSSVAIGTDLLVVGAPGDSSNEMVVGAGAAYVFRPHDERWKFEAYLQPTTTSVGSLYGTATAVSGTRVVIGAPNGADCKGRMAEMTVGLGAAYVYAIREQGWSLEQCLDAEDSGRPTFFGGALSFVGDRLLIGAGWNDSGETRTPRGTDFTGAAYLEELGPNGWQLRSHIKAPMSVAGDVFGTVVALDETRALIAAPFRSQTRDGEPTAELSGAVYSFDIDPAAETAADKP